VDSVVELISVLAWPLTVLIVVVSFRPQIAEFLTRIREVEGPGDIKVRLDQTEIKRLIEKGQQANVPPDELAEQIVKYAELKDSRELRILRALFDEPAGRGIWTYANNRFYRGALDNLLAKGYVSGGKGKYRLTATGEEVCRQYLRAVLESFEHNHSGA
jgi:hypothetical protein